jgi:hypothetical protein
MLMASSDWPTESRCLPGGAPILTAMDHLFTRTAVASNADQHQIIDRGESSSQAKAGAGDLEDSWVNLWAVSSEMAGALIFQVSRILSTDTPSAFSRVEYCALPLGRRCRTHSLLLARFARGFESHRRSVTVVFPATSRHIRACRSVDLEEIEAAAYRG